MVYTFDENGNKTKEEHVLVDKVLGERFLKPIDVIVSRYNSNSQLIEEEYFNHDALRRRIQSTYSQKNTDLRRP